MKHRKTRSPLGWVIAAASLGFLGAGGMHLVRLLAPVEGDLQPPWRHGLFVLINLTVVSGLILRWRGFLYAFGALLLQQLYSHGWARWQAGDMAASDVGVVVGMPILFALLFLDRPTVTGLTPDS